MGKNQRHDHRIAEQHAHEEESHEFHLQIEMAAARDAAPGAGYLGSGAKAKSRTGGVTAFDDPKQQSYAHGAFMGAAGAFMNDPTWTQIFQALWPEELARVRSLAGIRDVMLALENNPVLAAYGECRALEQNGQQAGKADPAQGAVVPQEWDVWLDKEDPGNLSKVKIAHGGFLTTVLQSANKDMQNRVIGYHRDDVKGAKNGAEWMEIFGKAIAMYRGGGAAAAQGGDQHAAMQRALETTTADAALEHCLQFMKKEHGGGLILDVKSTYSTPEEINTFIATLEGKGVNVFGVGTFRHDQLAGIKEGVRQVKFFHGVQGVQNAADKGELHKGDHIMFNAGSLLSKSGGWLRAAQYGIDQAQFQQLSALQKQCDLAIGLYVQEGDIDEAAVDAVVKMVNKYPWLFRDGFAYGNLSGKAELETAGSGMGAQSNADALDEAKQQWW